MYDAIKAHPGISISEVARATDLYWTAVALHLVHLTRAGVVCTLRAGRRRMLFLKATLELSESSGLGLLSEPPCRRVAIAIINEPGRRVYELCDALGMSERAVYHHVKRLMDAGLVVNRRERATRGLEATPRLYTILATRDPRQGDEHEADRGASRDP